MTIINKSCLLWVGFCLNQLYLGSAICSWIFFMKFPPKLSWDGFAVCWLAAYSSVWKGGLPGRVYFYLFITQELSQAKIGLRQIMIIFSTLLKQGGASRNFSLPPSQARNFRRHILSFFFVGVFNRSLMSLTWKTGNMGGGSHINRPRFTVTDSQSGQQVKILRLDCYSFAAVVQT